MIYSSPGPQLVHVPVIPKEEKITPQWLGREAVDDFSSGKLSSVAVPYTKTNPTNFMSSAH